VSFLFWLLKSHSHPHSEQNGVLTILLKAGRNTSVVLRAGKPGRPASVLLGDSGAVSVSRGTEGQGERKDSFLGLGGMYLTGESVPLWKHLYLKAEHLKSVYLKRSPGCGAAM